MQREPQPVKLFTIATMYRYDKPQRGRYREHWQLSLENIGSADPATDAEVIQLYDALLQNLGVTRYELQLNSIGDRECRPAYLEKLNAWLDEHADVLDDDARQKRATSPLRVFDVKTPRRARGAAGRTEDRRFALRRVRRALRARARLSRRVRRRVHDRADARARARLLLAYHLGVHRPGRVDAGVDDQRRRPLRLPDRGDRRPADAGRGLRRGHRASRALARARRHRRRASGARRLPHRRRRLPCGGPRAARAASRTRHRRRHRLRRPFAQGSAHAGTTRQARTTSSSSATVRSHSAAGESRMSKCNRTSSS